MAGRQSEPSIDEILSSIRKVIAEDEVIDHILDEPKNIAGNEDILELNTEDRDALVATDALVDPDALVDQSTAQGLRQSLSTLAALSEPSARPQIVRSGETSLEGLVSELLRPMMKEWLDKNLPTLVETMVEREIKRITRKG